MKVTDYKLVLVIWDDADSHDTWVELKEVTTDNSMEVASVGWLVADKQDRLVLIASMDLSNEKDMVSGHVTIPKAQVKKVIDIIIKRPKKPKKEHVDSHSME